MKKIYLFAAAALTLAACSSDDLALQEPQQQQLEKGAIGFDAYTLRGVTRAGQTDMMTLAKLQETKENGGGFGVFGFYTDNNEYEQSRIPNYMYNQGVFYNTSYWEYSPIVYWPNEYGSSATSDDADKVTFFAYAPYVETNGTGKVNGDNTWGITGMSKNSQAGDPFVKYIASFERTKSVDLLWGIVGSGDGSWALTQGGDPQSLTEGFPWMDVQRPAEAATQAAATQRVKFTFAHALTQLSMNIDAIVDDFTANSNDLAPGTKIYVRSLSMTGVALKGALNLNNTEADANRALWLDYNGLSDLETGVPVVLYDGRKDGKEGVSGAIATNEKIVGFNPDIIQGDDPTGGVTKEAKKVFKDDPVMLIPTGEDMELEIVYDVETVNPNLATLLSDGQTHGSSIESKVRKTIDFQAGDIAWADGLENGKHYTINLHLGMNSVKFDVNEITPWVEVTSTTPDVYLPANFGGEVSSRATAASEPLSSFPVFTGLTYDQTTYTFSVSGLTPGETVNGTVVTTKFLDAIRASDSQFALVKVSSTNDFSTPDNKADAAGVAYVEVTLPGNNTVHALDGAQSNNYILIQGTTSLNGWKARFSQDAHPFDAQVASLANNSTNDEIVLAFETGSTVNTSALNGGTNKNVADTDGNTLEFGFMSTDDANFIKVYVNNTLLTYAASPASISEYSYDGANKKITIGGNLALGDKVKIELAARNIAKTADDGAKQTLEFTVGGVSFANASETYTFSTSPIDIQKATLLGVTESGVSAWTWTKEGSDAFFAMATANAAQATVTSSASGTGSADNVKLVATVAAPAAGSEYFFTTSSCTATFTLNITKLGSNIAFVTPTQAITDEPIATGDLNTVFDLATTVRDANNATISTTPGTEVTYDIVSQTLDGAAITNFAITSAGVLSKTTALTLAKTYELVIRATFAKDGYVTSTANKTITVQTVGE